MAKYHINSKGVPAICRAEKGNCPFGGESEHYDNIEKANEAAQEKLSNKFGILGALKEKKSNKKERKKLTRLISGNENMAKRRFREIIGFDKGSPIHEAIMKRAAKNTAREMAAVRKGEITCPEKIEKIYKSGALSFSHCDIDNVNEFKRIRVKRSSEALKEHLKNAEFDNADDEDETREALAKVIASNKDRSNIYRSNINLVEKHIKNENAFDVPMRPITDDPRELHMPNTGFTAEIKPEEKKVFDADKFTQKDAIKYSREIQKKNPKLFHDRDNFINVRRNGDKIEMSIVKRFDSPKEARKSNGTYYDLQTREIVGN